MNVSHVCINNQYQIISNIKEIEANNTVYKSYVHEYSDDLEIAIELN